MSSKSNFIEKKNPAPTVVVLTPRKKRKMANVTNRQQEDMSLENGKNSQFRKSVVGKENQGFDIAYAESEASNLTAATVDSPAKLTPY